MSTTIHHLEVAALLVPFIGLALLAIGLPLYIAWFQRMPKGRR